MTCRYQRPHDDQTALCLSSIVTAPGQLVPLAVCSKCRVRDQIVALRDPATITPAEPPVEQPVEEFAEAGHCPHRGEIVRQAKCRVCSQRGQQADVYACEKMGECTLRWRGVKDTQNCLTCPHLPRGGS